MTNDHIKFQLPKGYTDEAGTLHREVEINPLTGKEEELVAQNHEQNSASLVTMVLNRCLQRLGSIAPVPADVTGRLPKEDRQFLLLKLREITFGDRVQATVACPWPECENKVDIDFSTKDITSLEPVDKEPQIELELEANCPGCGHEFTIPFDIPNFFFRELQTSIDLLYREVHFLAYHYHWSEREILEMSREKRHKYIEILLEEIEKMTDESILPPGGFRPLSRGLHPLKEDNKMEVKGMQGPYDDGHEMNHLRMKTRQKDPLKNETPQEGDLRDTEMEENPAQETRKRENIEIPGCSEKSAVFPFLSSEKEYVTPRQEHPIKNSKEPGNKLQITNYKLQTNHKLQIPNYIQIPNSELQINSKPQLTNKSQIPNPGIQINSKTQMLNRSETLDRENRQRSGGEPGELGEASKNIQKPEPGSCTRTKSHGKTGPPSLGVNEPRVFTQKKDKIGFSDRLPVKDKVTEIETQLPGKMEKTGTHKPIPISGADKSQKPELVKDKVTETQLSGKPGTVKEKSIEIQLPGKIGETADQTFMPISGAEKSQKPKLAKEKVFKAQTQSPARMEKAVSSTGKPGEPERMEKSAGNDKRTGESKVKVISKDEIVSRSSPEAALRIEQLREQVRRLNAKNSSAASHSSHLSSSSALSPPDLSLSSSGMEDTAAREIKTGEQPSTANPPEQPVTIVRSLPTRTNTSQTTSAFWERSYLARFHLRTLR